MVGRRAAIELTTLRGGEARPFLFRLSAGEKMGQPLIGYEPISALIIRINPDGG